MKHKEIILEALHDYRKWFEEMADESDEKKLRMIDKAILEVEEADED